MYIYTYDTTLQKWKVVGYSYSINNQTVHMYFTYVHQVRGTSIISVYSRRKSTTREEVKASRSLLAIRKSKARNRSGEGGRRTCGVIPDLRYDYEGREKKKSEENKWDGSKKVEGGFAAAG